MTAPTAARFAGVLVLAFAPLVAAGCSDGKPAGTVTGTVAYKGRPVTAGEVNFLSKTGTAATARLDPSGRFRLEGRLEAGDYAVYVAPPVPEPQAPGAKAYAPPKFEVPLKFRDPNTSGVTVTVKPGGNDIPVEFKE